MNEAEIAKIIAETSKLQAEMVYYYAIAFVSVGTMFGTALGYFLASKTK